MNTKYTAFRRVSQRVRGPDRGSSSGLSHHMQNPQRLTHKPDHQLSLHLHSRLYQLTRLPRHTKTAALSMLCMVKKQTSPWEYFPAHSRAPLSRAASCWSNICRHLLANLHLAQGQLHLLTMTKLMNRDLCCQATSSSSSNRSSSVLIRDRHSSQNSSWATMRNSSWDRAKGICGHRP